MKYLILDTETGGLIPNKHSLLEVCLMAWDSDDNEPSDYNRFYIKHRDYCVSPEALRINGLNLLTVDNQGIDPYEASELIINFIRNNFDGKDKFMILGKNPSFDRSFLSYHLYKHGNHSIHEIIPYRSVDITSLAAMMVELGKYPHDRSMSLSSVASYYNLSNDLNAHNAYDDCLMSIRVYKHILKQLKEF